MRLLTGADIFGVTVGVIGSRLLFLFDLSVTETALAWAASLVTVAALRTIVSQRNP